MRQIFDPVREIWVKASPEEIIRQKWLAYMIYSLQFPKELIAVEKDLTAVVHLTDKKEHIPARRIDIVSFAVVEKQLKPLLLLECKKDAVTEQALRQAAGYNYYIQAPYVGIIGKEGILLEYQEKDKSYQMQTLLPYPELLGKLYG